MALDSMITKDPSGDGAGWRCRCTDPPAPGERRRSVWRNVSGRSFRLRGRLRHYGTSQVAGSVRLVPRSPAHRRAALSRCESPSPAGGDGEGPGDLLGGPVLQVDAAQRATLSGMPGAVEFLRVGLPGYPDRGARRRVKSSRCVIARGFSGSSKLALLRVSHHAGVAPCRLMPDPSRTRRVHFRPRSGVLVGPRGCPRVVGRIRFRSCLGGRADRGVVNDDPRPVPAFGTGSGTDVYQEWDLARPDDHHRHDQSDIPGHGRFRRVDHRLVRPTADPTAPPS